MVEVNSLLEMWQADLSVVEEDIVVEVQPGDLKMVEAHCCLEEWRVD